jgi:spore coat protein U-like protein
MKRLLQLTLVLLITAGLTTVANAQIDATATVESNVTVTDGNPLDFGTLAAGANSTVNVGDATAGTFQITGNGGTLDLSFSFLNGGNLVGPGDDIAINFDNSSAAWDNESNSQSNTFDPTSGATTSAISADSDNTLHVFIGGSIDAAANQTAGTYTEEITLTASYN